jgi:hypothetical protein
MRKTGSELSFINILNYKKYLALCSFFIILPGINLKIKRNENSYIGPGSGQTAWKNRNTGKGQI